LDDLATSIERSGRRRPLVLEADSSDYNSLVTMARSCRCVASTVGPYLKYGRDLVKACVESETHYCDLTGEFPFVREMIETHHDRASRLGVKIVCSAGFDCVPIDICTMLAIDALPCEARSAFGLFTSCNGTASGGTLDSIGGIRDWAKRSSKSDLEDPYYLAPNASKHLRVDKKWTKMKGVSFSKDFMTPTVPHVMALVDNRVVRRSLALRNQRVSFDEAMSFGGVARMAAFSLLHLPDILRTGRPKAGSGPSESVRRDGSFSLSVVAKGELPGQEARVHMQGLGDPGYAATAVMLAECALCLARDNNEDYGGGVLTPSTACGKNLAKRLAATGHFQFQTSVTMPPVPRL